MAAIAMTDKKINDPEVGESRIPVLTVFKNNAIIKNIFIILNKNENTVVVGRHPDCNIVLTHPSISRFHLKICFTPSSGTLSLLDLSSVHGTWVCGRKLEPGVSVDLKEGDTFTVGVSTRLYRLRWVSELDVVEQQQQVEVVKKDVRPDENLEHIVVEQEIPMQEDMVSFCCDEERKGPSNEVKFGVLDGSFGTETSYSATNYDGKNKLYGCQNHVLFPPYVQSVDEVDNTEKIEACPYVEMPEETNLLCTLREYLTQNICLPVVEAVQGTKMEQFQGQPDTFIAQPPSLDKHQSSLLTNIDPASFDEKDAESVAVIPKESEFGCTFKDNDKIEDILPTGERIFNSENSCLLVDKDIHDCKFHQIKVVEEVSVDSLSDGEKQDKFCEEYKSKLHDLEAKSCCEQGYSLDEIEDIGNKCIKNMDPASFGERGVAAVTVLPKEYELGCTSRDNDRIEEVDVDSISDGEKQNKCDKELKSKSQAYLNANSLHDIVDTGKSFWVESLNLSMHQEADLMITNKEENQTQQSLIDVAGCFEVEILESHVEATTKAKSCHEQGHSPDVVVQDIGNKCTDNTCPISLQVESVNSSVPKESVLNMTDKIENQTPRSLIAVSGCSEMEIFESHVEGATEKSSTFGNILSRRGKAASAPQVRTRKSRLMSTSNVDTKIEMSNVKDNINKSMPKDLFSVLDEAEIFTPNKENSSPNAFQLRFIRERGKLEEIKHSKSQRSHDLKANFSPNIYPAKSISAISNKENQTPKLAQEWKSRRKPLESHINLAHEQDIMDLKKNRVQKVPFQSLMNSGGNHRTRTSDPVSPAKTIDNDASDCGQILDKCTQHSHISGEQKRRWDMVVDTASLLNKESRKALQRLQGLKGTRLIIPRLVIRDLSSMKQQFRIFRSTSEASLALEWIEECLENPTWWIHIQSSMEEECRLIAPTLPASPQTQFIGESWSFPGPESSKEFASETVEDHILECALQYRSEENVGQIVLLSDDVTLKIKSMAKGLQCETVQEFRQSLVNPFSERFMWTNSTPRGLTWSCKDDVVLREKYCGLPSKAGLKLIAEQFLYLHV